MLGLDNGVARRWLHGGAWVAALMAGRRAGSRAKGRAVPFIDKGGGEGRAGTQRPGEGLAREGDGEVAGCATPSAACHAGACAGVRGSSTRSQGEAGWGSSCWGRCGASRAWRVAGQVAPVAYDAVVGVVQGGAEVGDEGRAIS